jgi:Domain of Unknown Function (DUF1080)
MRSSPFFPGPFLIVLLCAFTSVGAEPAAVNLFNGRNLSGWQKPGGDWLSAKSVSLNETNPKAFVVQQGQGILVNGIKGRTDNLLSEMEFADVEAHIEFNVPRESNSGVYFLGRYEIQVLDSWGVKDLKYSDCGGVYGSCSDPKPDFHGRPPSANASKPPGEWQSFDILFRAPRFDSAGKKTENARFVKVTHNGQVIHENVEVPRPTCAARWLDEKPSGPLMLQGDHGPVAYRNIVLRKVELK